MRYFMLWYDYPDGSRQLLAGFRQRPGRHVWAWFEKCRRDVTLIPASRLRLSSGEDWFPDVEPGFPRLSQWHLVRTPHGVRLVSEPDHV